MYIGIFKIAPLLTDNLVYFTKIFVVFLAVLSGLYAYLFCEALSKNKVLGLSFAICMGVVFWCTDHLPAMCPRSFIWIGLFAYMYYKLVTKHVSASITCFILLLLSPNTFLLCLGMEFIYGLMRKGKAEFYSLLFNSLATIVIYKLLFRDIQTQGYGRPFTVDEMKRLAEFNPGGRHPIFGSNIWDGSWWTNEHWGLGIGWLKISQIIPWAFLVGLVYLVISYVYANQAKQPQLWQSKIKTIASSVPAILFYTSAALYFAAQIVFPMLYMPSRYIGIPWLLLSVLVIVLIFNELAGGLLKNRNTLIILLLAFSLGFWAYCKQYYNPNWTMMSPEAKRAIELTPKNSLIVSHPLFNDINSCDVIAKRCSFIDVERSMTYCHESQDEIRRRTFAALDLIYAPNKEQVRKIMDDNHITHILLHESFYNESYLKSPKKYLEPYNDYLNEITKTKNFYLNNYLKQNNLSYTLISRSALD